MADTQEDVSLTAAVTKAVEAQDKVIAQDQSHVEVPGQETEETEDQETREGEEESDQEGGQDDDIVDGLNPAELEEARILFRALKDPQKAPFVIDFLAQQAGYTKGNVQTRQDVKEAKTEILGILEKNLGQDFKFLAAKLAPAIQESLESLLQGREDIGNSDLRARVEKQELKEIQNETARTHTELSQEWFGTDDMPANVVKALSTAIDEFPPTDPNMTPERYYRRMFSLVAGELGLTKKGVKARSDRILNNKRDEVARNLSNQNRGTAPNVDGNSPRRLNLKDAVSLAIAQVDEASRK